VVVDGQEARWEGKTEEAEMVKGAGTNETNGSNHQKLDSLTLGCGPVLSGSVSQQVRTSNLSSPGTFQLSEMLSSHYIKVVQYEQHGTSGL